MNTTWIIIVLALVIVGVGAGYYFSPSNDETPGGCTQEARLCPDGSAVGRTGPNCEFASCPKPLALGACFVGGCSSQICSDREGVISTCEYKEEYACYQAATCERQTDGECGWTRTDKLTSCLSLLSR